MLLCGFPECNVVTCVNNSKCMFCMCHVYRSKFNVLFALLLRSTISRILFLTSHKYHFKKLASLRAIITIFKNYFPLSFTLNYAKFEKHFSRPEEATKQSNTCINFKVCVSRSIIFYKKLVQANYSLLFFCACSKHLNWIVTATSQFLSTNEICANVSIFCESFQNQWKCFRKDAIVCRCTFHVNLSCTFCFEYICAEPRKSKA